MSALPPVSVASLDANPASSEVNTRVGRGKLNQPVPQVAVLLVGRVQFAHPTARFAVGVGVVTWFGH